MRKIREVLRLRFGHDLSQRTIARSLRLSAGAVNGYLSRARRAGIAWPVPDHLDDEQLERLLFPLPPDMPVDQRPVPDWAVVHREALLQSLQTRSVMGLNGGAAGPCQTSRGVTSRARSCSGQSGGTAATA